MARRVRRMPSPKNQVKRKPIGGQIKPGQHLLFKPQVLELLGGAAYSSLWNKMVSDDFPLPIELGKPDGRTTRVAWIADEVYAWIATRPRRKIGHLAASRMAQEKPRRPARATR
jgi:predicted DNA-binding transcriptional regulator AlpA